MSELAGLDENAEAGLVNAMRSVEGRAFIWMILEGQEFLGEITDERFMIVQATATRLFDHCLEVNREMTWQMLDENYRPIEKRKERGEGDE